MVRSGLSPGSRTPSVSLWLFPLLVLVVSQLLAWLVIGGVPGIAVAWCGVVATIVVAGVEIRRERTVSALHAQHDAEREALRHRLATAEAETARLANELLPTAVERLKQGEIAEEALSNLNPRSEFSHELGAAHQAVLKSVLDAVEAQEGLRDSAQRAFVNVARRVQAIVHQQALDVREMEDRHGKNAEFFRDLLHLDHGNALIGRLADSIAVLAGARPGRQWRQDVPLFNVLRGAMSRIKSYDRVDIHSVAEFAVVGPAVEPLIHALAELLDNATRYSPPQARVQVSATEVQAGVAIEIEDAGVGLTEEARTRAEAALDHAAGGLDLNDIGETPRLGLAVVGLLAKANNFAVGLRPSVYGGVRAVLTVPKESITVSPVPGGQIARAATLPPPKPRKEEARRPSTPRAESAPAEARFGGEQRSEPTTDEIPRNANGLPQRQSRRRAPASTGARPGDTGTSGRTKPAKSPNAQPQPGLWLAAFQDGISGKSASAGRSDPAGSDASSEKDE